MVKQAGTCDALASKLTKQGRCGDWELLPTVSFKMKAERKCANKYTLTWGGRGEEFTSGILSNPSRKAGITTCH